MMFPKIKLAVGIFILVVQLFMYINADAIYGPYAGMVRNVMLAYLILLAIFSPYVIPELAKLGVQEVPGFVIGFALTTIVMLIVPFVTGLVGEIEKGLTLALGFGFLHSFVKAFNEEVLFRAVLPKVMGGSIYAGLISSVFFGLFHMAVTGFSIVAMIFLSVLGFVWYLVYQRFGLMGSTGSHFAYNLAALGVLPSLFGI
jgi:membrane protease YdiL (CAAX protease family)